MKKMITILGPTASGKTPVAARLAAEIGGEIISADSRQVYRRMDIGTGKDLGDYGGVPYHLIDICEPGTKYNLFQYQQDFYDVYQDIRSRGAVPILCGGTGLYIEAVLKGYKLSPVPQNQPLRDSLEGKSLEELTQMLAELKARNGSNMHNTTDVDFCQRAIRAIEIETYNLEHPTPCRELPPVESVIIGISIDRELRREKITRRLKARLEEGMVDEVQALLDEGIAPGGLRSKNEIKILICYLFDSVKDKMSQSLVVEAIRADELANFFEIVVAFEELVKDGNLIAKETVDGEQCYSLSDNGKVIARQLTDGFDRLDRSCLD